MSTPGLLAVLALESALESEGYKRKTMLHFVLKSYLDKANRTELERIRDLIIHINTVRILFECWEKKNWANCFYYYYCYRHNPSRKLWHVMLILPCFQRSKKIWWPNKQRKRLFFFFENSARLVSCKKTKIPFWFFIRADNHYSIITWSVQERPSCFWLVNEWQRIS